MSLLVALFVLIHDGKEVPLGGVIPAAVWLTQLIGITLFHGAMLGSWD
jgi:hypothetical protein